MEHRLHLFLKDVNSDGKPDLITVNGGRVSVRLNQGNGLFGLGTNYSVSGGANSVVVGDINSDGRTDLITAGYGHVSILFNLGNGIFGLGMDYSVSKNATGVFLRDINGDLKPDVITLNPYSNSVSVLLNLGSGTFGGETDYAVGNQPTSLVIKDVNSDGSLDLVTSNSDNTVSVVLGKGDGSFQGEIFHPNPNLLQGVDSLALTDTNGDNKLDLVYTQGNQKAVLLGQGNGTFVTPVNTTINTTPLGTSPIRSWLIPNGSGDILLANNTALAVLHSDGSFSNLTNYSVGSNTVVVGDVNNDGKADLIIVNPNTNTVSVLINKGDDTFATAN